MTGRFEAVAPADAASPPPQLDPSLLRLPYRLRLGVTGHRRIDDPDGVRAAVHRLLDHLARVLAADGRVDLEWTVVSPLAKGADRIVAEAVLGHGAALRQPQLEVLAPLPLDDYRADFDTETDRHEFETLLARASSLTELNAETEDRRDPDVRNRCYRDGGQAVVRACEILIAIWDGTPARGEGGTGDVVRYAVDRGRVVLWIRADQPSADARLLAPPRRWLPAALRRAPHRVVRLPARPKRLSPGLHQLAAFLRDAVVPARCLRDALATAQDSFREAARRAGLPAAYVEPIARRLTPYFVRADALADAYRRRHTAALETALYLAATAVTSVALQVLFVPESQAPMAVEVASMLGILVALALNRRQAWHEKWVNDRYLAEHLRTATHVLVLGEDPSARAATVARILPFYAGPKSWLPSAVASVVQAARPASLTDELHEPARTMIADAWLLEQRGWHARNAKRKERSYRRRHALVVALFAATLTAATLHLLGVGHRHAGPPLLSASAWCTFLAIALPAWATAIHAVGKQLEYERVAARSKQMEGVLERLSLSARQTRSLDALRDVVQEATQVVGLENHEWSVLLSFAPPELAV